MTVGYKIKYGKNLTGIEFSSDDSEIITRLRPMGYDGLMLPEIYVDSPIIDEYPHPKIGEITYSDIKVKESEDDEEGYDTLEECYEELRNRASLEFSDNNIDKPSVNIKVDFVDLSKTNAYKQYKFLNELKLGDTVTVVLNNFETSVRVIKTVYDSLLHRFTELELGEFKSNYITDTTKSITNTTNQQIESATVTILAKAKATATSLITSATTGYLVISGSEILIMDTDDTTTAQKVWRWNLNGLGYSSTGVNGEFGLAITMDGAIVADFITAGSLSANLITTGVLKSANYEEDVSGTAINLESGTIDTAKFKVSETGEITATAGTIGGFTLGTSKFTSDFSGIYNYNDYDLMLLKAYIMGDVALSSATLDLLDANDDDTYNSQDFMRIKKIIEGTLTNTKTVSGTLTINSNNPRNNIVIKKDSTTIVTLGAGGIRTKNLQTDLFLCGKLDDDENFLGIYMDNSNRKINIASSEYTTQISSHNMVINDTPFYTYNEDTLAFYLGNSSSYDGYTTGLRGNTVRI